MIALLALAFAGEGSLVGTLFDPEGAPVPGVRVEVAGRDATSAADGGFALPVPAGVWTVTLSGGPYQPGDFEVRVVDDLQTEALITLSDRAPDAVVEAPPDRAPVPELALIPVPGTVRDADGPVQGAQIFVRGLRSEAVSDASGAFILDLPAEGAEITVIRDGYATATLPAVPGQVLTVALRPAARALEAFTISAPYVEGSLASVLDERRETSAVAEVLGAEEMSRSGASDAASALSRVTGLTVVGGKYVYVRGLGDRYSASTLDGLPLPSPEPERRVVPLDLFPASVLESVVVQKTYSPDLPGAFGGGLVELRTRRPPTELVAEVGLSGTARRGTTFTRGLVGPGGPTDFLGADAGHRGLPDAVEQASTDSPLEEGDLFSERGYTPEELEALGEAMPNRWSPRDAILPPGMGLSATLGGGKDTGTAQFGALAALTFGNDWQKLSYDRTYYLLGQDGALEPSHTYRFDETTNEVQLGAFLTAGWLQGPHDVRYTGMLNRSTDDTARIYEGPNRDVGSDIRITRLRWVERQLLTQRLAGTHALGGATFAWRGAWSRATRGEPDTSEFRVDLEPGTELWRLSDRPEGNSRFVSGLVDDSFDGGADLSLPIRPSVAVPGALKAGVQASWRDRRVDTRRFKFTHKGPASRDPDTLVQDPEDIFVPKNIGPDGFQFEEITRQTDNYTATQRTLAGFVMAEVPFAPWLRAMAGVRLEKNVQQVSTFELFNPNQTPVEASLDTLDVLPAFTATLIPHEAVQVRLGAGRTVSRPDFRELSPATFNDVTGGRQTFGNPELTRATIDHLDARLELYPSASELLAVSVFAKRFTDPIESIVVVSAQQSVTWENAEGATNTGVELEARKDLPANLWAAGNLALIHSRITLGENDGIQTNDARALQGQAPWAVNLQLGWANPAGTDALTLLYNASGTRIEDVGALGAPDTSLRPVHAVDVVASKAIGPQWAVTLKGGNLLDAPRTTVQGDSLVDRIRTGASASLGIRWSAP